MFSKKLFSVIVILSVFLFGNNTLKTFKCSQEIVIDGKIEEDIWKIAPSYSDLKTFEPDYGKPLSSATLVYTSYDNENLYFAFECKAKDPQKIQGTLTKRDNVFNEDCAIVLIDSHNDQIGRAHV